MALPHTRLYCMKFESKKNDAQFPGWVLREQDLGSEISPIPEGHVAEGSDMFSSPILIHAPVPLQPHGLSIVQ